MEESTSKKISVQIWSDIMCPFCYLGKHKFETALQQFQNKEQVQVEWKSFQLQPDLETDLTININEFLSKSKGIPVSQARQMNAQLAEAGKELDLVYNFEKIVLANTFKAHLLLHLAKEQNRQNEVKERLFRAYFTEGKNVDDLQTLYDIGKEEGLNPQELSKALEEGVYAKNIKTDIQEAQQIGVRGVPFFLFNRKFAVSGAQETSAFLEALKKTLKE